MKKVLLNYLLTVLNCTPTIPATALTDIPALRSP